MSAPLGPWLQKLTNVVKTGPVMVIVSPTIPVGALLAVTEISAASGVGHVTTHTASLEQATTQQVRASRQAKRSLERATRFITIL